MEGSVLTWLLGGDPAVGWQVERDLLDEPPRRWQQRRAEIATIGWGARLLAEQDDAGTWGQGLYGRKWTSTTYTLLLLRRLGLDPANKQAQAGCSQLLDRAQWIGGGISYWDSHTHPELCVNAMILSVCAYFGVMDERVQSVLEMLLDSGTDDGAWNCRDRGRDRHGSFHTTISVLESLAIAEQRGFEGAIDEAMAGAHEFMFRHRLFRSHRTGDVIDPVWLKPHFPPRWHYDVLRGLDHLAMVGADPDERCSDAIEAVLDGRRSDGRWPKGPEYGGEIFFRLEPGRVAGRWNTLRALRVLRWWNGER